MNKTELISIALWAIDKRYDYEKTMYSDMMYGKENFIDEVWEFVSECEEIGRTAFEKKYEEFIFLS